MNNIIKCTTTEETYEAIRNGGIPEICGDFSLGIRTNCNIRVMEGSPCIAIWVNSTPLIMIHGSSSPCIETFDSSSPTIVTFDSSSPTIVTFDSSSPILVSRDSSSPHVKGNVEVTSESDLVVIRAIEEMPKVTGVYKELLRLTSNDPIEWCKFFDLPIVDEEFVTLYKALDENFCSRWNKFCYLPGTTVEAPDWDPNKECGGGLHFSPSPRMAKEFNWEATKFVACKVKVNEVLVHLNGEYPEKVKAPRVYEIFEVDIDGKCNEQPRTL